MNADAAVSPTLFRHEGAIAQLGFHSPIMPSNGMDATASAAGSRLVAIKHLDMLQICKINRQLVY
jgi:hypothetical protein